MSRPPHARPLPLPAATPAHRHSDRCGCDARASSPARWAAALPALACLVCPACVSLYAKALAAFGVGLVISERTHGWLLAAAVALSLATSVWSARRTGRWASFAGTLAGAAAVVLGHALAVRWLEWAGVALLVLSGLRERRGVPPTVAGPSAAR